MRVAMSHDNEQPADLERAQRRELDASGLPERFPRTASQAFKDADYSGCLERPAPKRSLWSANGAGWWIIGCGLLVYVLWAAGHGAAMPIKP